MRLHCKDLSLTSKPFCRFFPSKAKAIADKIISDELNGSVYDEEDAKTWSINISDRVREAVTGTCIFLFVS